MFMFVFSVLTISIVGLFFQIVTALTAFFLGQQVVMGEQMMKWHALAYEYACTTAGQAAAVGTTITASNFGTRGTEIAGGYTWNTVFFSGTYGSTPSVRMIVTYVAPTETPGGVSASEVSRQLTKVTGKQQYRFSKSTSLQTVTFTTYEDGTGTSITISNLPSQVVTNSAVLVSDVTCD